MPYLSVRRWCSVHVLCSVHASDFCVRRRHLAASVGSLVLILVWLGKHAVEAPFSCSCGIVGLSRQPVTIAGSSRVARPPSVCLEALDPR